VIGYLMALSSALLLCLPGSAGATTYRVGTTSDTSAAPCGGASCSLRGLVAQVAVHPFPPDVIEVPEGTYRLNQSLGALVIDHDLSLRGAGAERTTVEMPPPVSRATTALANPRVFDVLAPSGGQTPTVQISGLKIAGGTANDNSGDFGGDIRNAAKLALIDDWITDGFACSGGGIANVDGTLSIERSLISANSAACGGGDSGGVENYGSPASGPSPDLPGHLMIEDSTIAANDARLGAGLLSWNDETNTVQIANSTIAENSNRDEPSGAARGAGAGLGLGNGIADVQNTIIADNFEETGGHTTPTNCAPGPGITALGDNIDSGSDCGFTVVGGLSNTDPLLGSLQANGGPTETMALAPGSPAIDRVPASGAGCPPTDQRGVARPQGGACDIGAFELTVTPPVSVGPTPLPKKPAKCKKGKVKRHGKCVKRHKKKHRHRHRHHR
jgi:hypothetical protein